jgi:hypothetical protein
LTVEQYNKIINGSDITLDKDTDGSLTIERKIIDNTKNGKSYKEILVSTGADQVLQKILLKNLPSLPEFKFNDHLSTYLNIIDQMEDEDTKFK